MKKISKKLSLAKTTVRNLSGALGAVRGGGDDNGDTVIDTVEATKDILATLPRFTESDKCRSAWC